MRCHACGRDERCSEERNGLRCQNRSGHSGPHWVDVGSGGVTKWGAVLSGRCAKLDSCLLRAGHEGSCEDGFGNRVRVEMVPVALEDAPWEAVS